MKLHLWHFTHSIEAARSIERDGFLDPSTGEIGVRWPCFSLAGQRYWEQERGPALVEVWIDIDDRWLAYIMRIRRDGERPIVFYQIVPELLNAPGVKRLAHDSANDLPTPER